MTTLYIAGPMAGIEDSNYPAFNLATDLLRAAGFTVLNPAENETPTVPSWENWMRLAIGQLVQADGVALLPGWTSSRGAQVEEKLARTLRIPRHEYRAWLTEAEHQAYMVRLLGAGVKV